MKLRRADRDLTGLTVLGLLLTGPRHTYEMHRMMIDTNKSFVTGLPRSMYHAVDRLLRDELIHVHETSRDGSRPERTVYALNDAGHAELRDRVSRLLQCPDPDTTLFFAALSFTGCLSAGEAVAALRTRAEVLSGQIAELDNGVAAAPGDLPRLLLIESEYERNRLAAEHDWVQALVADIDAGHLPWPDNATALLDLLPAGNGAAGDANPSDVG